MRAFLAFAVCSVMVQASLAVELAQDLIFSSADSVCRVRVDSVEELRYFHDGTSLWCAHVQLLNHIRGSSPASSTFVVHYEAPAVKFCPPDSICGAVSRCPPFPRLEAHEEATLALRYRDFAGLSHIAFLATGGCIQRASDQ